MILQVLMAVVLVGLVVAAWRESNRFIDSLQREVAERLPPSAGHGAVKFKQFCVNETRSMWTTSTVRGLERGTRWEFTYRDIDGWEWVETVTQREQV